MSTSRNQVVVHFKNGNVVKGFTHDFTPVKDHFHLNTGGEGGSGDITQIQMADLKAVFFVKSLSGDRTDIEKKFFEQVDDSRLRGLKLRVVFNDGEIVRGISLGYDRKKKGFFMVPVDPDCNNDRIFVLADACRDIKVGEFAKA